MSALADCDAASSWNGTGSAQRGELNPSAEGALAATTRSCAAARPADVLAAEVRCAKLRGEVALPLPLAAAEARVVVIAIVEKEWEDSKD